MLFTYPKEAIANFFGNIWRTLCWVPIIYKDRDFDWCFTIELLIFKLHRIRKCILENGIIEDAQQVHDEILECANKLQAMLEDNWCFDEIDAMWERNGGEPDICKCHEYLKAHPDIDKEYWALIQKHNEISEAKFKEAFDFLRDNIRKWWD